MEIPNVVERKYVAGQVHIMRGLPGSGKSTTIRNKLAKNEGDSDTGFIKGNVGICSADDYMIDPKTGKYCFRDYMIKKVHTLCYLKFIKYLLSGEVYHVVIDNTNLQHIDFVNYFVQARTMNYDVILHQLYDSGKSDEELSTDCIHNVRAKGRKGSIEIMRKKWERFNIKKLDSLINFEDSPGTDYVKERCSMMSSSPINKIESIHVPA